MDLHAVRPPPAEDVPRSIAARLEHCWPPPVVFSAIARAPIRIETSFTIQPFEPRSRLNRAGSRMTRAVIPFRNDRSVGQELLVRVRVNLSGNPVAAAAADNRSANSPNSDEFPKAAAGPSDSSL